jgi:hypothetical protein
MADITREEAAKWLEEDACIREAEGFLGGAKRIRMGAAALRRLDELERLTQKAGKFLSYLIEHFDAYDADDEDDHLLAEDLRNILAILTGDMQMPPEEEKP